MTTGKNKLHSIYFSDEFYTTLQVKNLTEKHYFYQFSLLSKRFNPFQTREMLGTQMYLDDSIIQTASINMKNLFA